MSGISCSGGHTHQTSGQQAESVYRHNPYRCHETGAARERGLGASGPRGSGTHVSSECLWLAATSVSAGVCRCRRAARRSSPTVSMACEAGLSHGVLWRSSLGKALASSCVAMATSSAWGAPLFVIARRFGALARFMVAGVVMCEAASLCALPHQGGRCVWVILRAGCFLSSSRCPVAPRRRPGMRSLISAWVNLVSMGSPCHYRLYWLWCLGSRRYSAPRPCAFGGGMGISSPSHCMAFLGILVGATPWGPTPVPSQTKTMFACLLHHPQLASGLAFGGCSSEHRASAVARSSMRSPPGHHNPDSRTSRHHTNTPEGPPPQ